MSKEEKIITHLDICPNKVQTAKIIELAYCQPCLLCENTREIPSPGCFTSPWVCDECKEAVTFLKDFIKQATVAKDTRARMEEPSENVHPL